MKMKKYSFILITILLFSILSTGCSKVSNEPIQPSSSASVETISPTPSLTPSPTPKPTVGHALVDFNGMPLDGYEAIDPDQAGEIAKNNLKSENENIKIPVYSEDELLLGKYSGGEGAYNCTWPGFDNSNVHFDNSVSNKLAWILSTFPNGAWRKMDDDRMYLMYDTDKGSRIYLFFYPDNLTSVRGYSLISCKKLSYNDISSIKLGNTIEDVMAIDPTAKFVKILNDRVTDASIENYTDNWGQPITTVHLLTDGIMKITYERTGEKGSYIYTITNIEYYEDFNLKGIAGTTNYQIAEMDYVE